MNACAEGETCHKQIGMLDKYKYKDKGKDKGNGKDKGKDNEVK